jgi:hypothetical protein
VIDDGYDTFTDALMMGAFDPDDDDEETIEGTRVRVIAGPHAGVEGTCFVPAAGVEEGLVGVRDDAGGEYYVAREDIEPLE